VDKCQHGVSLACFCTSPLYFPLFAPSGGALRRRELLPSLHARAARPRGDEGTSLPHFQMQSMKQKQKNKE
jgi:hypothetical protein